MAISNGYCSLDELRSHLGDSSSNLPVAVLERAVESASRAIEDHCGRAFWQDSSTAVRTYFVADPYACFVDDISTRTGLVVKTGTDGATFGTTLTEGTDFILEPRNADKFATSTFRAYAFWQIRMIAGTLPVDCNRPTLQVTARHGWSAVPTPVKQACLIQAARLYKRRDSPLGVLGVSEFGSTIRVSGVDPDVAVLLSDYVLPGFA